MIEIPLTQGKIALIDDEDFDAISKFKWHLGRRGSRLYAIRTICKNGKKDKILMHRELCACQAIQVVDHINGDGLDNRRSNLRACTQAQNLMNQSLRSDNSSGYKGVTRDKRSRRWIAQIHSKGKHFHVGSFLEKDDAYVAYCKASAELHGEFGRIK